MHGTVVDPVLINCFRQLHHAEVFPSRYLLDVAVDMAAAGQATVAQFMCHRTQSANQPVSCRTYDTYSGTCQQTNELYTKETGARMAHIGEPASQQTKPRRES